MSLLACSVIIGLILFVWRTNLIRKIVYPRLEARYHKMFNESLGEWNMFYARSAKAEAKLLMSALNFKVIYYGLENIPQYDPFIMIANENSILDGCFLVRAINYVRGNDNAKLLRIKSYNGDTRNRYSMPIVNYSTVNNKLDPYAAYMIQSHLKAGNALAMFPSGRYDNRLFDISDYFKFRSGFIRFARDAEVGILPVYIDVRFPFWLRLLNSIAPIFTEHIIHCLILDLIQNQSIRIIIGKLIPFNKIATDNIWEAKRQNRSVLNKYERIVFNLKHSETSNGVEL